MDKIDLECAETVKAKPTVNDSGFIAYSNTINFSSKWLDKSVYLITQWILFVNEEAITWSKKTEITKKVIKVGKISGEYDILTVGGGKYPLLEIRQKKALKWLQNKES